jgi:hypothetical protein
VPEFPEGLEAAGIELWRSGWDQAITWVSPQSDWAQMVEACRLADDLAIAREKFRATHDAKDGRIVAMLSKSLTDALSALGFNPTARTRLGVAEVKRVSKLEDLLATRETRRAGTSSGA